MSHIGTLISGEVTCECGWKSGHWAIASDACRAHDKHIEEEREARETSHDH